MQCTVVVDKKTGQLCGKELTEVRREAVDAPNASSGLKVQRVHYQCPDGHKFSEKVEVEQ